MEITIDDLQRHLPTIQDHQLRTDIQTHGRLLVCSEGTTLLTDRQPIGVVPLVTRGGVKVIRTTPEHQNLFLYFLRAGETCAMTLSSCLRQETSRVRAVTVANTEVILLPVARVYYYTRHYPAWNAFTLQSFQLKFDSILAAFEGLAFASLDERILRYLRAITAINDSDRVALTHETLAEELGASRVGVSRVLKRLETEGLVALARGLIVVPHA
ncbi:MAG: Crp/Fnr family transcriptional regulator [Bacteroidota bacterium]